MPQRLELLEKEHKNISIRRQCQLLQVPRSRLYYQPRPVSQTNETALRRLDELYTAHPFLGYRKLAVLLQQEELRVNRKRVRRLLRQLGLAALYPRPGDSSRPGVGNPVYPYLLKDLDIHRPGQVWATDITYIRLTKGFVYLVAVLDWYSRYALSWRISANMDTGFCLEALEAALAQGTPDIFNTDQGSQFTSAAFTGRLSAANVRISMDGRGSYWDNIFTERLWRSVKYEEVYLKEYKMLDEARRALDAYFHFYNHTRPHQALGYQTPAMVHAAGLVKEKILVRPVDMMDNRGRQTPFVSALGSAPAPVIHIPTGAATTTFG